MLEPFVFRDLEREWEELQVTPPWNLPMFYALYWHIINISACRFSAIRSSPQYIWTVINYWYKLYGKKSDDIIVNNSCTPIKCRARYFIKCHLFFPWPNELSSSLKKKNEYDTKKDEIYCPSSHVTGKIIIWTQISLWNLHVMHQKYIRKLKMQASYFTSWI